MSEARERTVEILKALAFVLVGFFGGVAAMAFIEGFRDGYDSARPDDAPAEQRPASAGPGTGG